MSKHLRAPGWFGDPLLLHQSIGCSWESFGNETSSAGTAWHMWHFRNRWCWKRLAVTLLRNTAKPAPCQTRLPLFPSASRFHSLLPSSLSFSLSPHPLLACSLFFSLSLVLRSRCNVILLCFQHVVFKMKRDKNCFCGVKQIHIYLYIKPLQLAKHLWMIPSAVRTLGGPRSPCVPANIRRVFLGFPRAPSWIR